MPSRSPVQAVGGVAAGAVALPAIGFAIAPIFHRGKERWEAVGPVSRLHRRYLQGGRLHAGAGNRRGRQDDRLRAPRQSTRPATRTRTVYIAISTRCAHLGCPVDFVEAAGNFICPCHGGVYDFEGKVIGGPPVRPLDRFQTRIRNGKVEVGPRYSVTSQLEPVRARDPGEFVGGIWEYLYPPRPSTFPPPYGPR